MKKSITNIVAFIMILAVILNTISLTKSPVYAEMTSMDKLLQNERLINVQDRSYNFTDIAKHWAKDGMYKLSYMGILTGFGDGTMKPDKTLSREEFIVMLVRAINLPAQGYGQQYYADVAESHWSYQYIQTAKAAGLMDIFSQSNLNPAKIITREEMAVIAANVVRDVPQTIPSKKFNDLKANYAYLDSIKIVTGLGIINGTPDGSFKPYAGASRAEAAVIIQRILDVKDPAGADETYLLQAFAQDYELSTLSNPNIGPLSREDLLSYSFGKENKQVVARNRILAGLDLQGINLPRSIDEFSAKVDSVSRYLAEISVSYKLTITLEEDVSKDYYINRKLYLKKLDDKWLIYNTAATYNRANEIVGTEKINLAWHYLSQSTPDMSDTMKINGLNVISPTWFTLSSGDGNIKSIADVRYSNWAHKNNYQVWGLVTNDFDQEMTNKMLSNPVARKKAVDMLIQYAKDYKLDGINVDFENMYTKDRALFTQFVKELYQKTKTMGITLSVDVTVIIKYSNWSECYDRKALAQVSDYVALMAYDQYWAGSPVSGSVSQLKWVEDHLKKVLQEVPKEKLLLGMPFYTRVWKEEYDANNKLVVTSKAVSMEYAEQQVAENYGTKTWDAVSGQYFATYQKGGATYKIWLEDARSIKLRVELANKYNLAGVASWKLGMEKQGIWEVIATALGTKIASK